jgi:hypothetical protein
MLSGNPRRPHRPQALRVELSRHLRIAIVEPRVKVAIVQSRPRRAALGELPHFLDHALWNSLDHGPARRVDIKEKTTTNSCMVTCHLNFPPHPSRNYYFVRKGATHQLSDYKHGRLNLEDSCEKFERRNSQRFRSSSAKLIYGLLFIQCRSTVSCPPRLLRHWPCKIP